MQYSHQPCQLLILDSLTPTPATITNTNTHALPLRLLLSPMLVGKRTHLPATCNKSYELYESSMRGSPLARLCTKAPPLVTRSPVRELPPTYYGVCWADSVVLPPPPPSLCQLDYHPQSTQCRPSKLYGQAARRLLLLNSWRESKDPSLTCSPTSLTSSRHARGSLQRPHRLPATRRRTISPIARTSSTAHRLPALQPGKQMRS